MGWNPGDPEFAGRGPTNGLRGAAKVGGSANGGLPQIEELEHVRALASRYVMAGRFHFVSMNFNRLVWSWTTWETKSRLAYGEMTTQGTRKPV